MARQLSLKGKKKSKKKDSPPPPSRGGPPNGRGGRGGQGTSVGPQPTGQGRGRGRDNTVNRGPPPSPRGTSLRAPPPPGRGSRGGGSHPPWLPRTSLPSGYIVPEMFDPNVSFSSTLDAPSATAGYDEVSRVRILADENAKKEGDTDDTTSRSQQEKLDQKLSALGIDPIIIADDDDDFSRYSDISVGNESYILDLAQQSETREKDLKAEALDDALVLYKMAMREGSPDSEDLFLMILTEVQNELEEKYQDHYERQDRRLQTALQEELEKREQEGMMDKDPEVAEHSKGAKSARVSQFIKREERKQRKSSGRGSPMEGNAKKVQNEDNRSGSSLHSVELDDGNADVDVEKGMKPKNKEKKQETKNEKTKEKKTRKFGSVFGKQKQEEAETKDGEHAPGSKVFRELKKMEQSDTADGTNAPEIIDEERGIESGLTEDQKKRVRLSRIITIGIVIALVFDIAMLVLYVLN